MSQENVDKTRHFIDAYNRRDFDAAVEDFDPEIDWVLPAMQGFDSCVGPDQIILFWQGLDETMDELRLNAQEFVDAGERVAVRLRYYGRGKGSGVEIETECTTRSPRFATERSCGWSTSPTGPRPSTPPALLLRPISILAEPDLVEGEQQRAPEPGGYERDGNHLGDDPDKRARAGDGEPPHQPATVRTAAPPYARMRVRLARLHGTLARSTSCLHVARLSARRLGPRRRRASRRGRSRRPRRACRRRGSAGS